MLCEEEKVGSAARKLGEDVSREEEASNGSKSSLAFVVESWQVWAYLAQSGPELARPWMRNVLLLAHQV